MYRLILLYRTAVSLYTSYWITIFFYTKENSLIEYSRHFYRFFIA